MKKSCDHCYRRSGFTLIELVVVLAILAAVTTLAFQSVSEVQDERRYEASRQMLEDLETAILGDERVNGFVSDMGRLPYTVAADTVDIQNGMGSSTTYTALGLSELSASSGLPAFDVRTSIEDPEVVLPTGWHGPYLKLPVDVPILLDGWGNPMRSLQHATPNQPVTLGYHRLRDASNNPIIAAGLPVSIIQHLGANGFADTNDLGLNADKTLSLVDRYLADVKVMVDFDDGGGGGNVNAGEKVTVRVFAPDPTNAANLISFDATTTAAATTTNILVPEATAIPAAIENIHIGQRAIRAYLYQSDGTTLIAKSRIKYVTLHAGPAVNFIQLTIYRP